MFERFQYVGVMTSVVRDEEVRPGFVPSTYAQIQRLRLGRGRPKAPEVAERRGFVHHARKIEVEIDVLVARPRAVRGPRAVSQRPRRGRYHADRVHPEFFRRQSGRDGPNVRRVSNDGGAVPAHDKMRVHDNPAAVDGRARAHATTGKRRRRGRVFAMRRPRRVQTGRIYLDRKRGRRGAGGVRRGRSERGDRRRWDGPWGDRCRSGKCG